MFSSGTNVIWNNTHVTCIWCDLDTDAEVTIDQETGMAAYWCEACGRYNEFDYRDWE